ncbi:MAG: Oligopeptide transport system permease protein OppC [Candidatus Ozemobacter sibiricus]|jgi:ABC-type microcin C transport system permease subunit YejE|uniref:Oligopeptide transport system permease protein OppC n=1 Tax=Candidatus Ozemobacter sibiricus TaxID=2268124 RepID=A0A367ZQG2_9BACT|nr:MAG: Oligopeptide transport system permease protein OppC [Candidatus Ozemobacter sibiricus]
MTHLSRLLAWVRTLPPYLGFFALLVAARWWLVPASGLAARVGPAGSGEAALVTWALAVAVAGVGAWWVLPLAGSVYDAFALFLGSPLFQRRWRKFTTLRRGYYSFLIILGLYVASFGAEFLINERAIAVRYQGKWHFTLFSFARARDFGMTGYGMPNYRRLRELYQQQARERAARLAAGTATEQDRRYREEWGDDLVILPLYPYGPIESLLHELPGRPPHPPTWLSSAWRLCYWDEGWFELPATPPADLLAQRPGWRQLEPLQVYKAMALEGLLPLKPGITPPRPFQHLLGTDDRGRDVFARMVYGFRISLTFALVVTFICYALGITIGALLGYYGGTFDIILQRFVEIWSAMPFLYTVMIISSIMVPSFTLLALILCLFGWMGMTYYIRAEFLREKARDYVAAARAIGCTDGAIIFRHILPNALTPVISYAPFAIVGNIGALVSLDFLGFGLPAPTPSWGELFGQGLANLSKPWLGLSPMVALFGTLLLVSFIGEAIREAFDPKEYSRLR